MFSFNKKRKAFTSGFSGNYNEAKYRKDSKRERFLRHKALEVKKYFVKFAILAIFASIVYILFFSSLFDFKNLIVSGNKITKEEDIRSVVSEITEKRIFKIFHNNLLLVKTSDIEKAIRDKFININNVSVQKNFPKTFKIEITEKPVDISWCNRIKIERAADGEKRSEKNVQGNSGQNQSAETAQCYFSDENNIIYEKAEKESAPGSIRVFRDEQLNIGDNVGDDNIKNFIRELAGNLNRKTGLNFDYLYLPPVNSKELHLFTTDGWKIIFDLNRNVNDELWVLTNVLKNKISDADKKNLDYIDLRVVDRIVYKLKE